MKIKQALVPPNPNELDKAAVASPLALSCRGCPLTSAPPSIEGSSLTRFTFKGANLFFSAKMEKMASTAPEKKIETSSSPGRWPFPSN